MAKSRHGAVVCHRVLTWAHVSGRKEKALTRLHDPDAADPPVGEFSTSELGAMLRETRVSLGRELEDVAAELRIRLVYLQAIEDGHLDDLPGITYATGFLRAYADFLGLDGEDLVRRFKAAGMAVPLAPDLHLPSPVEEGRLPTGSVLMVAALLAVGAYGGWYYMSSQGRDPIENVAALPERLAALVGIDGENDQSAGAIDAESREVGDSETASTTTSTTASMTETASNSATPGAGEATEPMANVDATSGEADTPSQIASAASVDNAMPTPTAPAETTAEAGTDRIASAIGANQATPSPRETHVTPTAPPPTVETMAAPEPPAAPKRKPAIVARAPEPQPAPVAATESENTEAEASAATTIVAAAASGETSSAGGNEQSATSIVPSSVTHRVVLRANIDTWVEVAAAEGVPVLSRLMREGETFVVPARPGLMMTTGNAGGIEILIDGKAIPRLGPIGEIRTNVALDAESLLGARTATP